MHGRVERGLLHTLVGSCDEKIPASLYLPHCAMGNVDVQPCPVADQFEDRHGVIVVDDEQLSMG